ncbi:hypothetical protein GCM10010294_42780 [Streptomyces griseoloalbus]|nr:hypothetical protein GCM10010294_42780 [Streptomyces griseoloalbus]
MDVHTHGVGDSEREAVTVFAELLEGPLIGRPLPFAVVGVSRWCQKTPGPMVRGSSGWWG